MNLALLHILLCPYTKSRLSLEAYDKNGDEIEFGVLRSEAGDFPIVAGIPILFTGQGDLAAMLRVGRYREAVAQAVIGPAPASGPWRITRWLQETYRVRKLGRTLERPRQQAWQREVVAALYPPDGKLTAYGLFDLAFRRFKIRPPEVFNYTYYRHGLPNHFVALSFMEAMPPPDSNVLDLGCGAGHLTRSLQRRTSPQRVIGLDGFFFYQYAARTLLAPDAWYVCGDVNMLPFRDDVFSSVFCSDAFDNFEWKWASLREMERVLNPGGALMLISLQNSLIKHLYRSRPLTPNGYRQLVAHLPHRIIPDPLTFERYMDGFGLAAKDPVPDDVLNSAPEVSLLAFKGHGDFADGGAFSRWPHADGALGINPLYVKEEGTGSAGDLQYVRQFPSAFYANEQAALADYLPERFSLTPAQQQAIEQNRPEDVDALVRCGAVLGLPAGYLNR